MYAGRTREGGPRARAVVTRPAAAVIPAPTVYIKVVAVEKLVVAFGGCDSAGLQLLLGLRGRLFTFSGAR